MISIDAIEKQVKEWGYKISNYERRLRASESPNIERVMKNGAIVGYRWKQATDGVIPFKNSDWCNDCGSWLNHTKDCLTLVKTDNRMKF